MGLKEIQERLYKKGEQKSTPKTIENKKDIPRAEDFSPLSAEELQARKYSRERIIRMGIVALVLLIVFLGIFSLFYFYKKSAFSEESVAFTITGPEFIESNTRAEFTLYYDNGNRVDLENTSIILQFPEVFVPEGNTNFQRLGSNRGKISIGTISGGENGSVTFSGMFFGSKDQLVYLNATLEYSPENFSSTFTKEAQQSTNLQSSAVDLEITAPVEIIEGEEFVYHIRYKNNGVQDFAQTVLQAEYPDGFVFISATENPANEENTLWNIGRLERGQEGEMEIRGVMRNIEEDNFRTLMMQLGNKQGDGNFFAFSENDYRIQVITSPLTITQEVNNMRDSDVYTGDTLNYVLHYKNRGEVGLSDGIVKIAFTGDIFDFDEVRTESGFVDSRKQEITWRAADIAALKNIEPGEEGRISFSLPIEESVKVNSENDTRFTGFSESIIDSADIPDRLGQNILGKDRVDFKLNSDIVLAMSVEKESEEALIVGEEETFLVAWDISNFYNDISEAIVKTSFPASVSFREVVSSGEEYMNFNERTNELVWDAGKVENGVGILEDKKNMTFRVALTPQSYQEGASVQVLNEAKLTAKDEYTKTLLQDAARASGDGFTVQSQQEIPSETE